MALALGTGAILLVVLLWELFRPTLKRAGTRGREIWSLRRGASTLSGYDPGRERRAEQQARALLRSCVEEHDWAMYRDLGGAPTGSTLPTASAGGGSTRATPT